MPLFECETCHCVDNTAVGGFWTAMMENKPQLCSECDPEIGKWHGKFAKIPISKWPDGSRSVDYTAEKAVERRTPGTES